MGEEILMEQDEDERIKILKVAVGRILLTHKSTRVFALMMSGPFLVALIIFRNSQNY